MSARERARARCAVESARLVVVNHRLEQDGIRQQLAKEMLQTGHGREFGDERWVAHEARPERLECGRRAAKHHEDLRVAHALHELVHGRRGGCGNG